MNKHYCISWRVTALGLVVYPRLQEAKEEGLNLTQKRQNRTIAVLRLAFSCRIDD